MTFGNDTFQRHARMYLEPAVVYKWKMAQQVLLQSLSQEEKVVVSGDMRAHSPGT